MNVILNVVIPCVRGAFVIVILGAAFFVVMPIVIRPNAIIPNAVIYNTVMQSCQIVMPSAAFLLLY